MGILVLVKTELNSHAYSTQVLHGCGFLGPNVTVTTLLMDTTDTHVQKRVIVKNLEISWE